MITDIEDGRIEVKCDKCTASYDWFSSNPDLRLMWCENCKFNRIEQLEKEIKDKNSHIASLIEESLITEDKWKDAVSRGHKLQLKLNNYEKVKS